MPAGLRNLLSFRRLVLVSPLPLHINVDSMGASTASAVKEANVTFESIIRSRKAGRAVRTGPLGPTSALPAAA